VVDHEDLPALSVELALDAQQVEGMDVVAEGAGLGVARPVEFRRLTVPAGLSESDAREAALAMPDNKFVPVDLALVGLVDELKVRPDGEFDFSLKTGTTRYS